MGPGVGSTWGIREVVQYFPNVGEGEGCVFLHIPSPYSGLGREILSQV